MAGVFVCVCVRRCRDARRITQPSFSLWQARRRLLLDEAAISSRERELPLRAAEAHARLEPPVNKDFMFTYRVSCIEGVNELGFFEQTNKKQFL